MKKASNPQSVVVALSGKGRSLANLLEQEKIYQVYKISGVISSRLDCLGVELARSKGLPIFCYPGAEKDSGSLAKLSHWLEKLATQWIVLAGYLKKFPLNFSPSMPWARQMINIHPALLPAFAGAGMYGMRVHRAVLQSGAKTSGASIHFLSEDYDEGALIAQASLSLAQIKTAEELASQVFILEKKLYPYVLAQLIEKKLPLARKEVFHWDPHDETLIKK